MCTWFCETFCCFLLHFQHRLWSRKDEDDTADDGRLESGQPSFNNNNIRISQHRYQGNTPSPPRSIPLAPIYPGGPPATAPTAAKRKKRSPPPTVPRAVPLPVRYPPGQTPTGKHFRHSRHYRPVPNRMKPLPPLKPSFDDRSRGTQQTTGTLDAEKPPLSDSYATLLTPAPVNVSPISSPRRSGSPVSVRSAGGVSAVVEEMDETHNVKVC